MKILKKNLPPIRQTGRFILPFIIILTGIALSFAAFTVALDRDQQKIRAHVEEYAEQRYQALKREIDFDLHVFDSVEAFDDHDKISRSEPRDIVRPFLRRHPSIQALEWIPCVPDSRRNAYERTD